MEGIKFEKVSRFKNINLPLPIRATECSAGYDFIVAEDIVLKPYDHFMTKLHDTCEVSDYWNFNHPYSLEEMAKITKDSKSKIQLVSTGVKAYMPKDYFLQLSVRSSTPLKNWIILGNGVGR